MFTGFMDGLSTVMDALGSSFKMSFADYCQLETVDDRITLVASDGSLCSVVSVQGSQRLRTGGALDALVNRLCSSLQSSFIDSGHAIQAFFEVDHDRTEDEIRDMQRDHRATVKRLGMDMQDLLDERAKTLVQWVSSERCYFVLWTNTGVLTKSERANEKNERMERVKGRLVTKHSQNPLAAVGLLRTKHQAFCEMVVREMKTNGIACDILNTNDALREIRRSVDPEITSSDWQPAVPGGQVTMPNVRNNELGVQQWEILWPRLAWQLCARDARIVENNFVEVGDRIYSPMYIDLFPREPQRFSVLFGKTLDLHSPWRFSLLIEGGGLDGLGMKGAFASLMGMVGSGNKAVDTSIKALKHFRDVEKGTVVKVRAALCTWAPAGEHDLLRRRSSNLANTVNSWGGCITSEVTGDPVDGLASTIPAFTTGSVATAAAAPMEDAFLMLPLSRPSSPWQKGALLFRSPDGKLLPYEPYSSLQPTWISLIFAGPGSGKSVLMNSLNLGLVMSPMNVKNLPRIAIIDIGHSSSGLISLLQNEIPYERRHEVAHRRLRMVEKDSINVFDTPLGCRFPLSQQKMFLANFMSLLMTEPGQDLAKGMSSLITVAIDEVYLMRSDKHKPKLYTPGIVREADLAIRSNGLEVDSRTTWWELVDLFITKGMFREAMVAQRQAVPLLADFVTVVNDDKVRSVMGDMRDRQQTGEALVKQFSRQISTVLSMMPILARPTAFDISDARIASIDLNEVAKSGGAQADWQTGVLYMMCRQMMVGDFYLDKDSVDEMPAPPHVELRPSVPKKLIRDYHLERIRDLSTSPKRICYDEFHRTTNCQQVRDQVIVDMREGRKFQVDIILASQSLEDFDKLMVEFASGIYVMDAAQGQTLETLCDTFGFTDEQERYALERQVHPPRKGGGTFLAQYKTKNGRFTTLQCNTLGPLELWAFDTTAETKTIRDMLYQRVGHRLARKVLAFAYPNTQDCVNDVERRREQLKLRGSGDEEADGNVYQEIVEELVRMAAQVRQVE